MQIKCFTVGLFQTNMYVVSDSQGCAIIDPACLSEGEQQALLKYIESLHLSPEARLSIVATHGHLDHLWGAAWASEQWNIPVIIPEADIPMVERMQEQYDLFGISLPAQPFPIVALTTRNAPLHAQIISTPGHTPGSVCLYWPEEKILLSGDTLFCCGYGRTDLPGGNEGQLVESLTRLMELPPETSVYPGHGHSTTIGDERQFYRV